MARMNPSRQNFVCGGPYKGRGERNGHRNHTRAELKGLPSPKAGKRASCGPRPNGNEEHQCRWAFGPRPRTGVRSKKLGKSYVRPYSWGRVCWVVRIGSGASQSVPVKRRLRSHCDGLVSVRSPVVFVLLRTRTFRKGSTRGCGGVFVVLEQAPSCATSLCLNGHRSASRPVSTHALNLTLCSRHVSVVLFPRGDYLTA